jgi:hypothetical protein
MPRLDQIEDTIAILHREYELRAIAGLGTDDPDTTTYVGTVTFELAQMGFNLWAIREWRDFHRTSTDTSWADFKNGYR